MRRLHIDGTLKVDYNLDKATLTVELQPPHVICGAGAPEDAVRQFLRRYVGAYHAAEELDEPDFDNCCTVGELTYRS